MHYPLYELIEEARLADPAGRTLAVKRAAWLPPEDDREFGDIRMRLLNGTPEEYLGPSGTSAAGGFKAVTLKVAVDAREKVTSYRQNVKKDGGNDFWEVEGFRYVGRVLLPKQTPVEVVGVDITNEVSTGFLHVLEGEEAVRLFQSREA